MKLRAIADLHLAAEVNRAALAALPAYPEDWLLLAGDVCEATGLFADALAFLARRFARVIWTPGNHELWLTDPGIAVRSSPGKYDALVAIARRLGVVTPEDPYPVWPVTGAVIAPVLALYDYSFRPAEVARDRVVAWAAEQRNVAADERLIHPAPFPDMDAWCAERCAMTEARLERELPAGAASILVSHFPLREDLIRIPRVPRFTPWCGTRRTVDWHRRFNAVAVVSGHLHTRRGDWRDGTFFQEVSLGYPRQWDQARGMAAYLRDVLPPQA